MPLSTILIFLVILFLIATVPIWPYSRAWGFWPCGVLGLIGVVLAGYRGESSCADCIGAQPAAGHAASTATAPPGGLVEERRFRPVILSSEDPGIL
jgi:hypothetical protein